MEDFLRINNRPLSNREFKRLSAAASGRPYMTATMIAKSALFKLAQSCGKDTGLVSLNALRLHLGKGIDSVEVQKYKQLVKEIAEKNGEKGMQEYAAIMDYNPLITHAFAMRYACRHDACQLIPKSEAGWFICGQYECESTREYWFCAGCGGQFLYKLGDAEGPDSRGQTCKFQHVVFMQMPWGDGKIKTMCAGAVEPTPEQKAIIQTLKGITAESGIATSAGVKTGLISLVIQTNKAFDDMVGDTFPRKTVTIKAPMHVSLGRMKVKGNGILSLAESAIGTQQTFYDMLEADKQGHFGLEPVIWGPRELHLALELIVADLHFTAKQWAEYYYHPTMWNEDGVVRKKPSKSTRDALQSMEAMQNNPSAIAQHFLDHPNFTGEDIGMRNGAEEARMNQGRNHTSSAHVRLAKTALTEHVSAQVQEEGAARKKPRREDGPAPKVADLTAAQSDEQRKVKNKQGQEG